MRARGVCVIHGTVECLASGELSYTECNECPGCNAVAWACRRCSLAVPQFLSQSAYLSDMFRAPNGLSSDLCPIDAAVKLLVHQPANHNIVSSHEVQPMRLFYARFFIPLLSNDTLHCVLEYEVGDLVTGYERAGKRSAVACYDEDFLYGWAKALAMVATLRKEIVSLNGATALNRWTHCSCTSLETCCKCRDAVAPGFGDYR